MIFCIICHWQRSATFIKRVKKSLYLFSPMSLKLLSISLMILCAVTLRAQNSIPTVYPPNERFGVKEGLSQGLVMAMLQDKEGYMWFGTGEGLNKYDGYINTVYRNNPLDKYSLPENAVSGLAEDEYGHFWVATFRTGLYLFDRKTERFYATPCTTGIITNGLTVCGGKLMLYTGDNILLYAIKPVNFLNDTGHINQNMQLLFSYNAVQKNAAYKLSLSKEIPKLWMPDCSAWLIFNDTVLHYTPVNNFKSWQVKGYSLRAWGLTAVSPENIGIAPVNHAPGHLLIYAQNAIAEFDWQQNKIISKTVFKTTTRQRQEWLYAVNDSIFALNDDERLLVFNRNTKKISNWNINVPVINSSFCYTCPLIDAGGVIWFGSNGWGALKCDLAQQHFASYRTYQTALDIYSTKINSSYDTLPHKLRQNYFMEFNQVTHDKQNIFWMYGYERATNEAKLMSYNPAKKAFSFWPGPTNKYSNQTSVYSDPQNRLWICTNEDSGRLMIYQMNKQTGKPVAAWQLPVNNKALDNSFIMQWYQDANQVFWLATVQGLYRFDFMHNTWKHWLHKDGDSNSISINWLYTLCPDQAQPQRYLWLGTYGNGFDKFDILSGKTVKHYSMADGLPNNVVYGILPDESGNLWLSTNKGLSCFNPVTKEIRNFSHEDGLPGDEFNHFMFMKLKNNDLLFGGVEGFTVFTPATVLQKQKAAPIVFTGLSISNKPVDWKQDSTVLAGPINYAKTITLQPGQNMFTISFATLEYRSNKKKFYKYKLDGFDKNWTEPSINNQATYTNLSPRTYTFYVTGTNGDGVWNDKGASIKIIVLPYWYQTYWFMAMVAIAVIAASYSLYRYRLQQALKMERLRNRIASDLHDEIGSTLSSISLYGESAKMMMKENAAAGSILSKINASTGEMMEAMSDIVWAVNTRNDGLDNLANRMRSFAVQITESINIQLHFTDNENMPQMPLNMEQRKNIYLVFKEAVNNAVKYSGCQNLWVSFVSEHHVLKMTVKDDGRGFSMHTPPNNNKTNGNLGGNGIANMKSRAEQIKGKLFIDASSGEGTQVTLHVNLKKS